MGAAPAIQWADASTGSCELLIFPPCPPRHLLDEMAAWPGMREVLDALGPADRPTEHLARALSRATVRTERSG